MDGDEGDCRNDRLGIVPLGEGALGDDLLGDEPLGDGHLGVGASTSQRIVTGRRGVSPRLLGALVVALVAAGAVLTSGDGDAGETRPNRGDGTTEPTTDGSGAEMEVIKTEDVAHAYATAAFQLSSARTFAFRGTVRSGGESVVRPGSWIADQVTVEGAVHLPRSITTEVAVGPDGSAVETVTSGPVTWSRRAAGRDELGAAPWAVDRPPEPTIDRTRYPVDPPPSRLGMALVVDAIQASGDRRDAPRDEAGRRVIRATVADRLASGRDAALVDAVGTAEVVVTLDDAGDVARVELTSGPGYPELEIALDIERIGAPRLITEGDLGEPITQTLPPDALTDVGLGSLHLTGLPQTWALTDAFAYRAEVGSLGAVPSGCGGPVLRLTYDNLQAVTDGELWLSVRPHSACERDYGASMATDPDPRSEPLTAGRFSGSVLPQDSGQHTGWVSDGTTAVDFTTDMPPEDAAAAIASLVSADAVVERGSDPAVEPLRRSSVCQVVWCR